MREEMTNLRQAAQQILEAIDTALPYAPHRGEFDRVADIADTLRATLEVQPDNDNDCHLQGICQRSGYSINSTKED